jgi:hypothetical protein
MSGPVSRSALDSPPSHAGPLGPKRPRLTRSRRSPRTPAAVLFLGLSVASFHIDNADIVAMASGMDPDQEISVNLTEMERIASPRCKASVLISIVGEPAGTARLVSVRSRRNRMCLKAVSASWQPRRVRLRPRLSVAISKTAADLLSL